MTIEWYHQNVYDDITIKTSIIDNELVQKLNSNINKLEIACSIKDTHIKALQEEIQRLKASGRYDIPVVSLDQHQKLNSKYQKCLEDNKKLKSALTCLTCTY